MNQAQNQPQNNSHEGAAHPAPHRDRVATHEALFAVWGAPIAWLVQLSVSFAFSSNPCFAAGDRLFASPGVQLAPLIASCAALLVALAALWVGVVLFRRTAGETGGGKRHLVETGQGRTRFMAVWAMAFSCVFVVLIAVNIGLLVVLPTCVH